MPNNKIVKLNKAKLFLINLFNFFTINKNNKKCILSNLH